MGRELPENATRVCARARERDGRTDRIRKRKSERERERARERERERERERGGERKGDNGTLEAVPRVAKCAVRSLTVLNLNLPKFVLHLRPFSPSVPYPLPPAPCPLPCPPGALTVAKLGINWNREKEPPMAGN